VTYACRSAIARSRRGRLNQLQPSFPRSPGIIPAVLSAVFSCPRRFVQRILPAALVKLTFKAAARSSSAAGAWPMARARRGRCPYCGSWGIGPKMPHDVKPRRHAPR
jgi:hypothetical protein